MGSTMLLARAPHPIRDVAVAAHNGTRICGPRGYCGPFVNEEYYNGFPEDLWWGMGDCEVCGSTRDVAAETAKRTHPARVTR